jgi:hypothetical protein
MNRRKLIALLVILGLLTGLVERVPVARASVYSFTMFPIAWVAGYIASGKIQIWMGSSSSVSQNDTATAGSATLDGVSLNVVPANYPFLKFSRKAGTDIEIADVWLYCSASIVGDGLTHTVAWSGIVLDSVYAVPNGSISFTVPANKVGQWYEASDWTTSGQYPLTVTIDSGPMAVDLVDGGTWHATAAGGSGGYTYAWAYWSFETVPNYTAGTGQTFAHVFPAGIWTVGVKATDSSGATVYTTITVTAASVVGSYEAHFTRSGAYGQYMSVYVTDTAGNYVTISSTANTNFGIYATSGGEFGWVNADYEAVQFVTYTWRWTMSGNFGGATSPPPADFWLWSSIHLAVPNVDLVVNHHFVSLSDTYNTWSGPEGNPLTPETPPVPTSVLPDWLQAVYDMFVRLFKALFQPDATEFGKQLAGSWVTIASPVPSITPQYTIPFPNPNHLLAPTGDSVNIDFSGIMSYSGYSTYKLIVQVFLDAILVFVVIALVT